MVSVSAARTGVCWCEQGCHLSSLDQKSTRTSAGTIRQGRPGRYSSPAWTDRRVRTRIGFGKPLRCAQKTALIVHHLAKNKSHPSPASFASPKPWAIIQRNPHSRSPDQTSCPLSSCTPDLGHQSPPSSLIMSPTGTSTPTHNSGIFTGRTRKRFVSYRLRGEYEKPWLEDPKFKRTKYNNYVIYVFVFLGVCAAGVVAYFQIRPAISGPVSAS